MSKARAWRGPTAEELAAYVDGELNRPALRPLARRVEAWLADHPDAQSEIDTLRELQRACDETIPAEPSEAAWQRVLAHLPARSPRKGRVWHRPALWATLVTAAVTGAAAAILSFWPTTPLSQTQPTPPAKPDIVADLLDDGDLLEVARAEEIEVLQVEGPDSHTLVVNNLPMHRPLELLERGEVSLIQPMHDPMLHARIDESGRPLFYARTDAEREEED